MLPSLIISCLFSAFFFYVPSRAQASSDRLVTTVQSTITVVPIAYTASAFEYLPAPPSPTCDVGKVTCPACHNEDIDIEGGATYNINCDAALSSNTSILQPTYITPNQCLVVCDSALDCMGTTLASNGSCVLVVGPDYRLGNSTGDIAFVQSEYAPSNSTGATNSSSSKPLASKFFSSATIPVIYPTSYPTSSPNASNTPILHQPKPYYTNYTFSNATVPVNSSTPTDNTCSISNPTCPACNNQTLTDMHNVTYTVLCGYKLDATLDYAYGEPLPAAYCMARCDERNTTCLGASWSTEECVLALGPYIKVQDPDYMAFLRAALPAAPYPNISTAASPRPPISTGLSYTNMSRYDGGSGTLTTKITPTLILTNPIRPTIIATDPVTVRPTLIATNPSIRPTITVTDPPPLPPTSTTPSIPTDTSETTPLSAPSQASPGNYGGWGGGRPPWVHGGGDYGVEEGSRHHGPPGSWWQGGRPPWAHWGWGWGKPGSGYRQSGRRRK